MARRREANAFSLAFLDVMSCGFGAIVLLFLIVKHNAGDIPVDAPPESEVDLIEQEIRSGQEHLLAIRNTISDVDDQLATAQGLASRIQEEIDRTIATAQAATQSESPDTVTRLKQHLAELQQQKDQLEKENEARGRNLREFAGRGRREYLSGLRLGGNRLLILMDSSASMLDDTILNVLRFRALPDPEKRRARKWQQAVRTVDWLTARFPKDSLYQIYDFNVTAQPVLENTRGTWLDVRDSTQLEDSIKRVRELVPTNGTSLINAIKAAMAMKPLPDNIFLITDGLPTQGSEPGSGMVSGDQRLKYFWDAMKPLPNSIPVNVILLPMEGDPDAAGSFWRLAQLTNGSFITPTEDWP